MLGEALQKWDKWFREGHPVQLDTVPQVIMGLGQTNYSRKKSLPNCCLKLTACGTLPHGRERQRSHAAA